MRQPNRKRKVSMQSQEHMDQDGWSGQTEEEKKPRVGATPLTPGYPDPEKFSWTEYLEATQANAVPARVFNTRAPHGFLPNMKLEAVDKRNPQLIRVATIVDVDYHRVRFTLMAGTTSMTWMGADSPDIHPVGWCRVTGHPLEVPHDQCFWMPLFRHELGEGGSTSGPPERTNTDILGIGFFRSHVGKPRQFKFQRKM